MKQPGTSTEMNGQVKTTTTTGSENTTVTEAALPNLGENVFAAGAAASPSSATSSPYDRKGSIELDAADIEPIKPAVAGESINLLASLPNFSKLTTRFVYCLARNLYKIKNIALVLAFIINFMLLFYKVTSYMPGGSGELMAMSGAVSSAEAAAGSAENLSGGGGSGGSGEGGGGSDEDEDAIEWLQFDESWYWIEPLLRTFAMVHSVLAFCMLIAYYNLKVPLIIFKREKEIARRLEFDGLYIAEQPENDYPALWDKLVISTASFPVNYWDKFVKKRVISKYAEQYDYEALSVLLGMSKSNMSANMDEVPAGGFFSFITNCDWKYQVWKVGVTFMDNVSWGRHTLWTQIL